MGILYVVSTPIGNLQDIGIIRFDGLVGLLVDNLDGKHSEVYLDTSQRAIEKSKEMHSFNRLPRPMWNSMLKEKVMKNYYLN